MMRSLFLILLLFVESLQGYQWNIASNGHGFVNHPCRLSYLKSFRDSLSPEGTYYCQCGICKTAYTLPSNLLEAKSKGERGARVKCSVCEKEWYQMIEKLPMTSRSTFLTSMSKEKIDEVRKILSDTNIPKYPRIDKVELFVGNIPFEINEISLADLFAEYGVVSSHIIKDPQGTSRGFGFVELASLEDAQQACEEMNDFPIENRKLTVKMAEEGKKKPRKDKI